MRRRQLFVYRYNDKPGDVMLINGSGRVIVVPPYDVAGRVADGFTPYGVVVVPTSHDTYGDGTMGGYVDKKHRLHSLWPLWT